jgi:hypothetical protein
MTSYYALVQFFNNVLLNHPNIKTFTSNEVIDFDIHKQTIFPLAHLVVNDMTMVEGKMRYGVTLMVADRITGITEASTGVNNTLVRDFRGLDSTLDVINSCQGVLGDLYAYIKRNPQAMDFTIDLDVIITPFVEKGHNIVAGCQAELFIDTPFDVNACLFQISDIQAEGASDACCPVDIPIEECFILQEDDPFLLQEDGDSKFTIDCDNPTNP